MAIEYHFELDIVEVAMPPGGPMPDLANKLFPIIKKIVHGEHGTTTWVWLVAVKSFASLFNGVAVNAVQHVVDKFKSYTERSEIKKTFDQPVLDAVKAMEHDTVLDYSGRGKMSIVYEGKAMLELWDLFIDHHDFFIHDNFGTDEEKFAYLKECRAAVERVINPVRPPPHGGLIAARVEEEIEEEPAPPVPPPPLPVHLERYHSPSPEPEVEAEIDEEPMAIQQEDINPEQEEITPEEEQKFAEELVGTVLKYAAKRVYVTINAEKTKRKQLEQINEQLRLENEELTENNNRKRAEHEELEQEVKSTRATLHDLREQVERIMPLFKQFEDVLKK